MLDGPFSIMVQFQRARFAMSWRVLRSVLVLVILASCSMTARGQEAAKPVVLNDDGGWCWFQDERALVVGDSLVFGSVASGHVDPARKGNIEVTHVGLDDLKTTRTVLHERLQLDDHDVPALAVRSDGRLIAVWARHGNDAHVHHAISEDPGDGRRWRERVTVDPSARSRVTYSNVFLLTGENDGKGRLYDFFRGYDDSYLPSLITSDDQGEHWDVHGIWIRGMQSGRHRPYVKYASNGRDRIDFVFTEGHPRDVDNGVYHAFYRAGRFHTSTGKVVHPIADGPLTTERATRIFEGSRDAVAWTSDVHLDGKGRPVCVFSVQRGAGSVKRGSAQDGQDHRYHYARFDGTRWRTQEIAFAGTRLYAGEDDYTGLICIDPDDTNVVVFSSDVDPRTGEPWPSGHYEITRGRTIDGGVTWAFERVTQGSTLDNLRPIVPAGRSGREVVMWLRGTLRSYTNYALEVVAIIDRR
ncbi:MAG: BNR-4 repeat-containing protein [Planctomycetes bacterium]|nr:BNR-4 repeat-containing protein [Planctomycetota bacterium]